jgi:hypothetical protein
VKNAGLDSAFSLIIPHSGLISAYLKKKTRKSLYNHTLSQKKLNYPNFSKKFTFLVDISMIIVKIFTIIGSIVL